MPTYGYRCTVCDHTFERFQKMTDAPVATCERCEAPVRKILYPVGISFKGDGFYVNDYAKKPKESSTAKASTEAKPAESATPATESKPAESKPAESKPAESKTAETKTESKPAGTA